MIDKNKLPKFDFNEAGAFNLLSLTKEQQRDHLQEIYNIHNSEAFHREINSLVAGIQHFVMMEAEPEALKGCRQLLVFIQGMKDRFAVLATQFKAPKPKPKEIVHKSPIG